MPNALTRKRKNNNNKNNKNNNINILEISSAVFSCRH